MRSYGISSFKIYFIYFFGNRINPETAKAKCFCYTFISTLAALILFNLPSDYIFFIFYYCNLYTLSSCMFRSYTVMVNVPKSSIFQFFCLSTIMFTLYKTQALQEFERYRRFRQNGKPSLEEDKRDKPLHLCESPWRNMNQVIDEPIYYY